MRYDQSKLGRITGSLWEGKTKTGKKNYFIQNLPPPTFFKQSSLNFYSLIFVQKQKKKREVGFSKILSKNNIFLKKLDFFFNFLIKLLFFKVIKIPT